MHILTVLDRPRPGCFAAEAAAQFASGVRAAGHSTEIADLGTTSSHAPQAARRADALCLVFPLQWWGISAQMKNWLYARHRPDDIAPQPAPALMLVPSEPRSAKMDRKGYAPALNTSWIAAMSEDIWAGACRLEFLVGSSTSEARRTWLLQRCFDLGQTLHTPNANQEWRG